MLPKPFAIIAVGGNSWPRIVLREIGREATGKDDPDLSLLRETCLLV